MQALHTPEGSGDVAFSLCMIGAVYCIQTRKLLQLGKERIMPSRLPTAKANAGHKMGFASTRLWLLMYDLQIGRTTATTVLPQHEVRVLYAPTRATTTAFRHHVVCHALQPAMMAIL
jgi:hypothetical protein